MAKTLSRGSVTGDLGAKRESASASFFKRKIKGASRANIRATPFKVRPFQKAGGGNLP